MRDATADIFHPFVAEWFHRRYGGPTEAQAAAWPLVAAGRNLLLSAPTGTGKTYSAFLYAIDRLASGAWEGGAVRVLYVSPLKALNSDIRRNLEGPLAEIRELFQRRGAAMPEIRVQTRSGDTPERERRTMTRKPPEILITTPESLNLILSSPNAREMLAGLKTVILDEIHSVLGTKRGTHLITAVDRLVLLSGEFQRIGLSATVRPIETAAAFLGGYIAARSGGELRYEKRPVEIVRATQSKSISLSVRYPAAAMRDPSVAGQAGGEARATGEDGEDFWQRMAAELREIIVRRRSSLVFVNSRRLAERLTHAINEGAARLIAYPHHGSLSRELRGVVEKRLKNGELEAIVATSSLELGIDIGDLDEVLLVESPMSIAAAVQRIGRAGHAVGEVSSGTLFASHGMDLVRAAVVSKMIVAQEIEETRPVLAPLDVLAQVVVSMTAIAPWRLEELFAFLRTSYPYHDLTRRQFDLVVAMLEGRFEETRLRELRPRVSVDRIEGTIQARDGTRFLLYSSGGTIPDRGYYGLHLRDSGAKIGELDEEFVWERRVGDAFVLGSQRWRIVGIDHQRVSVIPWKGGVNSSPFWKAERMLRSFHYSERILTSLETWERALGERGEPQFPDAMETPAKQALVEFLRRQQKATASALPHRHHIIAEHTGGRDSARYLLLHTLWGGRVNEPLALALSALLRREGTALDVAADNDTVVIVLPQEAGDPGEIPEGTFELEGRRLLEGLAREKLEGLIQEELEGSGFFGARFRENCGRALLLPRLRRGRRTPLWLSRLRSRRLLERVQRFSDFPILAETWRECIRDEFDLSSLSLLLGEVADGRIQISEVSTAAPSPFASGIVWIQTNQYLYGDDTPAGRGGARQASSLTAELLREMIFTAPLEIRIPSELARTFEAKLRRTAPGYAPRDERELLDWLKERGLIPLDEWRELLAAVERDGGPAPEETERALGERIIGVRLPGGEPLIAPLERQQLVERAMVGPKSAESLPALIGEWIAFSGPIPLLRLSALFAGAAPGRAELVAAAVEELCEEEQAAAGSFLEGSTERELCDRENLEHLLTLLRRERRPEVETRPLTELAPFLAEWQGLLRDGIAEVAETTETERRGRSHPASSEGSLPGVLERLFGFPAPAPLWESDLLPARLGTYRSHWLDALLRDSELEWFGCGRERVSFRFHGDAELFERSGDGGERRIGFQDERARYTYWELKERSELSSTELTREIWREVWRGRVAGDGFEAIRRGAQSGFKPAEVPRPGNAAVVSSRPASLPENEGRRGRRSAFARRSAYGRWTRLTPLSGTWHLASPVPEHDSLEELEIEKERARLLLDRYGVLFRELTERELPAFRWRRLFRTLRLLELSGEVVSGRFFDLVPGLQFASTAAVERLAGGTKTSAIFWMNAVDPASPCGLGIPGGPSLPSRLASTHLVFHGTQLVLVSRRLGTELRIEGEPQSPDLERYLEVFPALLERDYDPPKSIKVEKINGVPIRESPYRSRLAAFGFEEDFKAYTLRGRRHA